MKLFDNESVPVVSKAMETLAINNLPEKDTVNSDIEFLDKLTSSYNSVTTVYSQVASENFSFIDKGNHILYNEYIKTVTKNLGFSPVIISQEAIDILPGGAVNHHISLEGLIGDMWAKIKQLFGKIYDSIKKFFTTYFTRLGRLKNKLKNLSEVLSESNKDLKEISSDSVPGGLASKYPVSGQLSLSTVEEVLNNISIVGNILTTINTQATGLAKKEILDSDFVAKIKSLRDLAKSSKEGAGGVQDKLDSRSLKDKAKSFIPGTDAKAEKNELKNDKRNLEDVAKQSEADANKEEGKAKDIGSSKDNIDLEFDDKEFLAAKKEFATLLANVEVEFNKLKNKTLINGKSVTKVEVKEDSGIEIDMDENKETPSGITFGSRSDLIKLIAETTKVIESVEKISKNYGDINDTIMKNMDTVDKLIRDIDAIKMESLGKYKTVLTNKIKERLNLMKTFFNNYNKINKSLFGYVLDTADGCVLYTVSSLKKFG